MQRTVIVIEVEHDRDLPHLADMVAGRAYTISGVKNAEVLKEQPSEVTQLERLGFTASEIALGCGEVHRS